MQKDELPSTLNYLSSQSNQMNKLDVARCKSVSWELMQLSRPMPLHAQKKVLRMLQMAWFYFLSCFPTLAFLLAAGLAYSRITPQSAHNGRPRCRCKSYEFLMHCVQNIFSFM